MADQSESVYVRNGKDIVTPAIAGIAMLTGIAGLFWQATNPKGDITQIRYDLRDDIKAAETRANFEIKQLKEDMGRLLSKDQHSEFAARKDKDTDILRDEINRLRSDQVPRSEHQQHWAEQSDRITAIREVLENFRKDQSTINDNMRKEFGSTFTASDQLKNLQDQIKTLNTRIDALNKQSPTTPLAVPHANPASFP